MHDTNTNAPYNNTNHIHKRAFNQGSNSGYPSVRCAYVTSFKEQNPTMEYQQSDWDKTCKKYNEENKWQNKEEKHNQLKLLLLNIDKKQK